MPDLVTHYYFGSCVYDELPSAIQNRIHRDIFDHCCAGPDVWFSLGFLGGGHKKYASRGNEMQNRRTGDFLCALAEEGKAAPEKELLFSYLAGFLCHYCLDSRCHPYIESKTGNYDGSAETRPYWGGHTRLERAIDSYILREYFGCVPWHFPLCRKILRLKKFPEAMAPGLNRAYERVYGWRDIFPLLQHCVSDQRLFYALAQDRFGFMTALLKTVDTGKGEQPLPGLTYYHKDISDGGPDYLNNSHTPWHHYRESALVSTAGFFDLFNLAKDDGCTMISACYDYIFAEGPHPAPALENRSYESGFDCADPRNNAMPHYESIF